MRIFIILLLTLNTNIQAQTKDELVDEDRIENIWTVSYYSFENYDDKQTYVVASVNGKISHGDRFSIMIPTQKAEYCDYGKSMTTFYTTAGNKNINKLQNKIIPAVFKNENIKIEIENTSKFLMGDRVFISMGVNTLSNIKNFFQNKNLVSLQLADEEDFKVIDYFDIKKNSFSLNGMDEALDRARNECLSIVNENNYIDKSLNAVKN